MIIPSLDEDSLAMMKPACVKYSSRSEMIGQRWLELGFGPEKLLTIALNFGFFVNINITS